MKFQAGLRFLFCIVILLAGFGASTRVSAQEITGSIVGSAIDSTGAVLAGAKVTITNTDKNVVTRTVTTDEDGNFSVPLLPVGNYEVSVEQQGFKKYVSSNIKLDVNQRRTIDVVLETGAITDVVTVESSPLQVDLQSPMAANLISGTQARELTLNNRNFLQLTTLMPGVTDDLADQIYIGTSNPFGQANIVSISVNGARSSSNQFSVDGANTNDAGSNLTIQTYPSVDAIGEFKILRSLYPAEIGRSGGGQVNVVTRSGTKDFHGTLYEFFRNEVLNANDFFSNARAPLGRDGDGKARRTPFRYNNFGWTIGGPVWLPEKVFGPLAYNESKDKTFLFFSQEFRRVISYPNFRPTIPDRNLRRGIFPAPVCVEFNATFTTCTRTATQIADINPAAQAYIREIYDRFPEPGASFILDAPARNVFNARQEILKIDHSFSSRFTAFYRLQNDSIPTTDANALFSSGSGLPGVSTTETDSPGRTQVVRATFTISPRVFLEGGYSYSYGAILSEVIGKINQENSPSINITLPFVNTRGRIPTISGHGFSAIQGFGPYDNFSNNHAAQASLSIIRGPHTMKLGGLWNKYRKNENALAGNNEGLFSAFNATPRPTGTAAFLQQWANFLLGNAATFTQAKFDFTADLRTQNWEIFAQDEWRALNNLTLYLGVRYSRFGQPFDNNNQLTNFDPSRFNPANAIVVNASGNQVGTTGDPLNGIIINNNPNNPFGSRVGNEDNNNIGPRIGLAWDPFKKGRTSIRSGYGMYYDQTLYGTYLQNIGTNPPVQEVFSFANVRLDNPAGGSAAFSNAIRSLRGVALPYVTPDYQHWSLDIQQQITSKSLVTVGYFGSKGTHLLGVVDLNLLPPGKALNSQCLNTAGATVPCQAPGQIFSAAAQELILDQIRPYRGFRAINIAQTRFNSNYHSLQFSFQQRFSRGSQINAAYTWAKNLTDNQTDRSTAPQNPYDTKGDYGRSQLDRRHVFSLNYIYELPFFLNRRDFIGQVLGGWQVSGIVAYQSGLPFTATTSNWDPAGIGFLGPSVSGPRPDQIGDPNSNAPRTAEQWFNRAAFADVPQGVNRVATAGRGTITGPPTQRWDLTLSKRFRFSEDGSRAIQFRAEAFNIFNHTNFRALSTNITATTYGQVTTTRDPRIMQVALKLYF